MSTTGFKGHIEVFLSPAGVQPEELNGRTAVVIDVLRASSTIIFALSQGAREVIPVANLGEAGRMASTLDSASYVLGGERGGKQIEGYQLGNSPLEYTADRVADKTVILSTTNGTPAIQAAAAAGELLVGGFVNARALAQAVRDAGNDVTIVCAGWENRVSLEDTLCAGFLVDLLLDGSSPANLSDTAYMALWQYRHDQHDLSVPISRCNHARRLEELGHGLDIPLCIEIDAWPVVPKLHESRLVLTAASEQRLSHAADLEITPVAPESGDSGELSSAG
ncbi:MAG: 2-phosphosulfolactate phosphatase [Rhodothermales bacterium]|jgi:2-phosphosulfolactate phosphatase